MNKRLLLALVALILIAGGFQLVRAQQSNQTQKLVGAKPLSEQTPPPPGFHEAAFYTYKYTWYGFLTDNKDRRLGTKATADQIHASVAAGAYYTLIGGSGAGRKLEPADAAAKYAGQWVMLTGLFTNNIYSTGATADPDTYGVGAGQACQGCPVTKVLSIKITSIKPDTPPNDEDEDAATTGVGAAGGQGTAGELDKIPDAQGANGQKYDAQGNAIK